MTALAYFDKDPEAILDYKVDWSEWLGADTISSSSWEVQTGITKVNDAHDQSGAVVWLSGGVAGTTYAVVNRIVTAAGRQDDRTLLIRVRQR